MALRKPAVLLLHFGQKLADAFHGDFDLVEVGVGLASCGGSGIFAAMTTIDDSGRIAVDPAVCNGRPVVKGTRITVQTVLEFLGAGDGIEDMLEEYPTLTREDVLACLQFSSRLMGNHFTLLQVA